MSDSGPWGDLTDRNSAATLSAENIAFKERLIEAQRRVEALLEQLPAPEGDADDAADAGPEAGAPNEASQ